MTKYTVSYSVKALKQFKKLNPHIKKTLIAWIEKNLIGCDNPRKYGKALVANHSGEWRYRVGDYRIIADIQDDIITILILEVGHRKMIYEQ